MDVCGGTMIFDKVAHRGFFLKFPSLFIVLFALAACSSGGGNKDGEPLGPGGSTESIPVPQKLMVADNGKTGMEFYRGGVNGPELLKDVNVYTSSSPQQLIILNGILYFTADDGVNGAAHPAPETG